MPSHEMTVPRQHLPRSRRRRAVGLVLVVIGACAIVALGVAAGSVRVVLARDGHLEPVAPAGSVVLLEPLDPATDALDGRVVWGTPESGRFSVPDPAARRAAAPEGTPHRVRLVVPWVGRALEVLAAPRSRTLLLSASVALILGAAVLGRRPGRGGELAVSVGRD